MPRLSGSLFIYLKLPAFDGIPWKDYVSDKAVRRSMQQAR